MAKDSVFKTSMDAAGKCLDGDALKPAVEESLKLAATCVAKNFERSETAGGESWPARKHVGDGHPLLIDTGRLSSSAAGEQISEAGNARPNSEGQGEHIRVVEDQEGYIASNVPYAAAHEHGVPERNLPARPFMGVDDETADLIMNVFADRAMECLEKAIGGEITK